MAQGIVGAVAIVAMLVAAYLYRRNDALHDRLLELSEKRVDDARGLLVECTKILSANAEAGRDQAEALRELRETLRAFAVREVQR